MIRTRYLAGTAAALATTLAALPFLGSPSAFAADGTASVPGSTLYTGDTVAITVDDGDASGAYTVDLMKGATKFATIGSGTEIDDVTSISWTIPTTIKTLVGTGYTIQIDPATGATFATSSFDIAASGVATAYLAPSAGSTTPLTTVEQLLPVYAKWTNNGATGGKVTISLLKSGETKGIVLKKDTPNDGVEQVYVPQAKVTAGNYSIVVTPAYKTATAKTSDAFAVTATSAFGIDADDDTITLGDTLRPYVEMPEFGTAKVELVDPAGKTVATLAKAYSYFDYDYGLEEQLEYPLTSAKLKAGTYKLRATMNEDKTKKVEVDITVTAWPALSIKTATANALAAGVTHGQSVELQFQTASTANGLVTVQVTDGTKVFKIDTKAQIVDGNGSVTWLVDKKVTAGTSYKVQVINNADTSVKAESSAFTVKVNPTTLASTSTTATTTTVAATTTTVAETTTS